MSDNDPVESATDAVADAVEDAHAKGADDARWEALERRLASIESRGSSDPVDLSPLEASIKSLGETFTGGLGGLEARLAALEAARVNQSVEAETHADADEDDEDDDPPELPPQVAIKSAAKIIPERPPRIGHSLFRRIGGGR